MFGFSEEKQLKKKQLKNAAAKMGAQLHRQVDHAVQANRDVACDQIASLFVVGYLYGFIRLGFINQGFEDDALVEKYLKLICKAAPGNLYKVVLGQRGVLEQAVAANIKEEVSLYNRGLEAGERDASVFSDLSAAPAESLYQYLSHPLLNQE